MFVSELRATAVAENPVSGLQVSCCLWAGDRQTAAGSACAENSVHPSAFHHDRLRWLMHSLPVAGFAELGTVVARPNYSTQQITEAISGHTAVSASWMQHCHFLPTAIGH